MTLKTTNMHGVSHTLCEWMREFRGSIRYQEALKSAIESDPDQLARDKFGVCISNHIDFGLQSAGNKSNSHSLISLSVFADIFLICWVEVFSDLQGFFLFDYMISRPNLQSIF